MFSHHQNIRHFYYSIPRSSKPSTKPTEFANRFAPFRQKKKAPAQRKALRSIRKKLCQKALGKKGHPQRDEGEHQPQAAEANRPSQNLRAGGSPCPEGPDGQQDVDRKAEQLRDRFRNRPVKAFTNTRMRAMTKMDEPDKLGGFFHVFSSCLDGRHGLNQQDGDLQQDDDGAQADQHQRDFAPVLPPLHKNPQCRKQERRSC